MPTKIITPAVEEVKEIYCDCCNDLILTTPIKNNVPQEKEFALHLAGSFGNNTRHIGLNFNHMYCSKCSDRIINLIENEFNIKIESNIQFGNLEENL